MARLIARQKRGDIDFERKKVADGVLVFGPVESTERVRSAGIGFGRGRIVKRGLQRGHQGVVGALIRPRHSWGRHVTGPKLPDHLLPRFLVRTQALSADRVELESRRLQLVVVAADAISIDGGTLG